MHVAPSFNQVYWCQPKTVSFQYPDDPGMHNEARHRYSRPSYRGANPGIWNRFKSNIVAIVIGMFIICVAFGLTFWNEVRWQLLKIFSLISSSMNTSKSNCFCTQQGRAVRTARSLAEGLSSVIPLATTEVAFEHNDGKLVHATGQLQTDQVKRQPFARTNNWLQKTFGKPFSNVIVALSPVKFAWCFTSQQAKGHFDNWPVWAWLFRCWKTMNTAFLFMLWNWEEGQKCISGLRKRAAGIWPQYLVLISQFEHMSSVPSEGVKLLFDCLDFFFREIDDGHERRVETSYSYRKYPKKKLQLTVEKNIQSTRVSHRKILHTAWFIECFADADWRRELIRSSDFSVAPGHHNPEYVRVANQQKNLAFVFPASALDPRFIF